MDAADPVLTFHDDWRVEQSGVLVAGNPVRIRYAKKRLLSGSDLSTIGPQSFHLTGYQQVDGGPATPFDLGGRRSPSEGFAEQVIDLPRDARLLELWFQRGGLYGTAHYDSDFGRNYAFDVLPALDLSGPVGAYVGEIARRLAPGHRA
jgi:uncharacterized protein DUF6209